MTVELMRALGALAEAPGRETERLADLLGLDRVPLPEEYTELFLFQAYPYASVYLGIEGMLGGDARDRVAGFWRVVGKGGTPPGEPDHLAAILGLYATLVELELREEVTERRAALRRARATCLVEYLLSWLPAFLDKLLEIAPAPYRRWALLLERVLKEEAGELGAGEEEAVILREAVSHAPPVTGSSPAEDMLVPARSGVIITRADLAAGARSLGLTLRAGERRYALEAMLSQDQPAVIEWLRGQAISWAGRHRAREVWLPAMSRWWTARALESARYLGGFDRRGPCRPPGAVHDAGAGVIPSASGEGSR